MQTIKKVGTAFLPLLCGCVLGNRPSFVSTGSELEGKTFYLDGAGNFGFGKESVPTGLSEAGYRGNVEHVIWTSYMGPLVDQLNLGHNREEARNLADRIRDYQRQHPGQPVNVIALSAGTGIAIFALEELPPENKVDNVVLLSSSLSADYDLTAAMRRVKSGIYVFWSSGDPILRGFVPIFGTVDRSGFGARAAGTHGAVLPADAPKETRLLYRKVFNIQWHPEKSGGAVRQVVTLRHANTTSKSFIRELVAPILMNHRFNRTVETSQLATGQNAAPSTASSNGTKIHADPFGPSSKTPPARRSAPAGDVP